jgi:hydroxypyruvate reductase
MIKKLSHARCNVFKEGDCMNPTQKISVLIYQPFFDTARYPLPNYCEVYTPEDLPQIATRIQVLMTNAAGDISADVIQSLPALLLICCFGAGVDNIDFDAVKSRQICVTHSNNVVTNDTADIAMALLLCLGRNIPFNHDFAKSGLWQTTSPTLTPTLTGKTLGIIGLGQIGKAIAMRASAFQLNVIYHGRKDQLLGIPYYTDLTDLARAADYLVVSCTGGPKTKNLVDHTVLTALGKNGYLINISRGSIVNEIELIFALQNNVIAGAGLDVFQHEPNIPLALRQLNNVCILPHIGSATIETRERMYLDMIRNIEAFFKTGQALTPVKLN